MSLEVTSVKLSKSTCRPNETVTLTYTLSNTYGRAVNAQLMVTFDGVLVGNAPINLTNIPPGSSAYSLDIGSPYTSKEGVHQICVSVFWVY